jgi:hypothetical protein
MAWELWTGWIIATERNNWENEDHLGVGVRSTPALRVDLGLASAAGTSERRSRGSDNF